MLLLTIDRSSIVFSRREFVEEVEALWRLRDPNLATVVGGELVEEPLFVVLEYSALGDLNQFLQDHVADTTAHLPPSAKTLRLDILNIVLKFTQTM